MSRAPPQPDLFAGLDAEEPRLPRVRARVRHDEGCEPLRLEGLMSDATCDGAMSAKGLVSGHDGDHTRKGQKISARSAKAAGNATGKNAQQSSGAGSRSARMTITLPKGPVLAAIKREAAKEGLSVSQAAFRALARGARRADLDVEDRLNRLEASLAAHRKATARDFALTQELVAALAQLVCERVPVRDLPPMLKAAAARDVEVMLRRVVEATGRG